MSHPKLTLAPLCIAFALLLVGQIAPAGPHHAKHDGQAKDAKLKLLTDAELDRIIAEAQWPDSVQNQKTTSVTVRTGVVPHAAAKVLFEQLLALNGFEHTAQKGFDWYNRDLGAGLLYRAKPSKAKPPEGATVLGPVHWGGRVREGRPGDAIEAKRNGLRELERLAGAAILGR